METILIKREGSRQRAYPLSARIRVTSHLGAGDLRYITDSDDGLWLGVKLDCESNPNRVDEIAVEHCQLLDAQPAVAA